MILKVDYMDYKAATRNLNEFIDWSKDQRCDFANRPGAPVRTTWHPFVEDIRDYKRNKHSQKMMEDFLLDLGNNMKIGVDNSAFNQL